MAIRGWKGLEIATKDLSRLRKLHRNRIDVCGRRALTACCYPIFYFHRTARASRFRLHYNGIMKPRQQNQ